MGTELGFSFPWESRTGGPRSDRGTPRLAGKIPTSRGGGRHLDGTSDDLVNALINTFAGGEGGFKKPNQGGFCSGRRWPLHGGTQGVDNFAIPAEVPLCIVMDDQF